MTEPDMFSTDLFLRQGLITGGKVPFLLGGKPQLLDLFSKSSDADVALSGTSMSGIRDTETEEQVETLPWATRYIKCGTQMRTQCRTFGYYADCWVNRTDYTPEVTQLRKMMGRAKWHPGDKFHQLQGRNLAFTVLLAMERALNIWTKTENFMLDDDAWHVKDYYKNIHEKVEKFYINIF